MAETPLEQPSGKGEGLPIGPAEHREAILNGGIWLTMERALCKDMSRDLSEAEDAKELEAIDDCLKSDDPRVRRTGTTLLQKRIERHERRRELALNRAATLTVSSMETKRSPLTPLDGGQPPGITVPVQVNVVNVSPERQAEVERLKQLAFGHRTNGEGQ